jgi:hypothetical protein
VLDDLFEHLREYISLWSQISGHEVMLPEVFLAAWLWSLITPSMVMMILPIKSLQSTS